jgi:hypothetical protein
MVALKQLALDIEQDSISSIGHYSFHCSGKVVGCYGRALCPVLSPESFTGPQASPDDAAAHEHQPKRQHRIIGRQRLRQLMFERLLPRTVGNP